MSPLRALSLLALAASAGAVLVDPLRSLEKPEYFAPGVLSINALLCLFTPGTQPDVTYPGTCESGSAYNNLATTTNEVVTYPCV